MRKQSNIQHPAATELYNYADGVRFDPGSAAEAFLPEFANPIYLYRGAGRVAGSLSPLQPAQVRFLPLAGLQGVGGVQAGSIISQPLLDPSQLQNPAVD
jgi:hypothetical protein